jgi:hypothetical protein
LFLPQQELQIGLFLMVYIQFVLSVLVAAVAAADTVLVLQLEEL